MTAPANLYPPSLTDFDVIWCGISFCSVGVVPPNFLCAPSLLAGRAVWETEKPLTLHKPCSAMTEMSLCYHRCFHQKSKAQTIQAAVKNTNSIPANTSIFLEDRGREQGLLLAFWQSSWQKTPNIHIALRERAHRLQHNIFYCYGLISCFQGLGQFPFCFDFQSHSSTGMSNTRGSH